MTAENEIGNSVASPLRIQNQRAVGLWARAQAIFVR